MQVKIVLNDKSEATMSLADWIDIGKLTGFCKAKKLKKYQVNEIRYTPNQPK